MTIEICLEGDIRFPFRGLKKRELRDAAERALYLLGLEDSRVTLILTDNASIRPINKRYRKKDSPTDVISFANRDNPFPGPPEREEHLGDVYLSLEQAWIQHEEYSPSFRDEVRRLLVHGFLHLVGYDHEKSKRGEERMRKKEDEILRRM